MTGRVELTHAYSKRCKRSNPTGPLLVITIATHKYTVTHILKQISRTPTTHNTQPNPIHPASTTERERKSSLESEERDSSSQTRTHTLSNDGVVV